MKGLGMVLPRWFFVILLPYTAFGEINCLNLNLKSENLVFFAGDSQLANYNSSSSRTFSLRLPRSEDELLSMPLKNLEAINLMEKF